MNYHTNVIVCKAKVRIYLLWVKEMHFNELMSELLQECKDTLGFNLAAMDHLKVSNQHNCYCVALFSHQSGRSLTLFCSLSQQMMALKSDALFRDAKTKLLEIRSRNTKRIEARTELKEEKRKKKKQKKSDGGHVWS